MNIKFEVKTDKKMPCLILCSILPIQALVESLV